mgnify:FL=1
MILIIDTTQKECLVGIFDGKKIDAKKWQWGKDSQKDTGTEVLENIDGLLKKHAVTLKSIKAIVVNQGPGSFTGVRVGITIANALGWSKNIPVYGYCSQKSDLGKILAKVLKEKKKNFSPVLPHYPKNKT